MAKKSKKAKIRCLGCDAKMREKAVACWQCGRPRPGTFQAQPAMAAAKAVFQPVGGPAFLAKAARPRCTRCTQTSRAGSRHCTSCGTPLLAVVKSADQQRREQLMAQFYQENDPAYREAFWQAAHPEIYGPNGTAS